MSVWYHPTMNKIGVYYQGIWGMEIDYEESLEWDSLSSVLPVSNPDAQGWVYIGRFD